TFPGASGCPGRLGHGRGSEELARVGLAHGALRVATEHSRDLAPPLVALDAARVGRGHALTSALGDEDVVVRPRRDLRKVRDREHLMVCGDAPHSLPDL